MMGVSKEEIIELGKKCPHCGCQPLLIDYPLPERPRPSDWGRHVLGITSCCNKKIRFHSALISPASNLVGREKPEGPGEALEILFREE